MSRVSNRAHSRARRKKVLKQAKGFRGSQSKLFRTATEKVNRALQFSYRDRRVRRREFRSLWITRIGIAAKLNGLSYSKLVHGLNNAQVALDRKVLSDLAIRAPKIFSEIVEFAKSRLNEAANRAIYT